MEKLVVMGGVGEDEMKGKARLITTHIYIYNTYAYVYNIPTSNKT